MQQTYRAILIVSTLYLSWLSMMIIHELGHVLGAAATGGEVSRVVLHPLAFSQTVLEHNPHPLIVCWLGPVVGVCLPLLIWLPLSWWKVRHRFVVRFFTGFCLVANGAYLGVGYFDGIGDAGDLIGFGASPWQLWLFGIVTVPAGFYLWHGLGPDFGLGKHRKQVSPSLSVTLTAVLALVFCLELALYTG